MTVGDDLGLNMAGSILLPGKHSPLIARMKHLHIKQYDLKEPQAGKLQGEVDHQTIPTWGSRTPITECNTLLMIMAWEKQILKEIFCHLLKNGLEWGSPWTHLYVDVSYIYGYVDLKRGGFANPHLPDGSCG